MPGARKRGNVKPGTPAHLWCTGPCLIKCRGGLRLAKPFWGGGGVDILLEVGVRRGGGRWKLMGKGLMGC